MAVVVSVQHLIEELARCSFCFKYGIAMVHRSGQVGVSKCDPPVWRTAQDLARGRLTIARKEEPGLRTQIGVSPAIQDDSGDVPPCVESDACEHLGELKSFCPTSMVQSSGSSRLIPDHRPRVMRMPHVSLAVDGNLSLEL